MIRLRDVAAARLAARTPTVVVEVAEARGSVPRGPGTRMLVGADDFVGTIGGGHLELKAIVAARAMLDRVDRVRRGERGDRDDHGRHFDHPESRSRELRLALGPSLGQCCGGAIVLRLDRLDDAALARWPASPPRVPLQLHGAGHVGRAIATLLATLDTFDVDWFDERDDGFPATTTLGSAWPAHVRRIGVDTVEAEVANAPAGAFFLVLTHEHALDLRIVEAVLRRGDFGWLGLIGSKTKRASFEHRLVERGVDAAVVARMTCPIGIGGIDGAAPVDAKAPETIAVAVVAQLLQRASAPTPQKLPRPPSTSRSTPVT